MATVLSSIFRAQGAIIRFILAGLLFLVQTAASLCRSLHHSIVRSSTEAERLRSSLQHATTYETWLAIARQLDELEERAPKDQRKETSLDREALQSLEEDDANFGKRLSGWKIPDLDGRSSPSIFAGTYTGNSPTLVEHVRALADRFDRFAEPKAGEDVDLKEWKARQLHAAGTYNGWTALVLQGGGAFALHHLGVTKALLEHDIFPKIIFGVSTGAWFAAMLAVMTDQEYLTAIDELPGSVLDALKDGGQALEPRIDWTALFSVRRPGFRSEPYDYERDVFANFAMGILDSTTTFQEAYRRTGRIVSIEIACDTPGTSNLLNYITTPNIIVSTAARASQLDDYDLAPGSIWEKSDYDGAIHPWAAFDETPSFRIQRQKWRPPRGSAYLKLHTSHDDAVRRLGQIFNTKHFIISQPRPCIFPFVRAVYWNQAQRLRSFPDTQAWFRRLFIWQWHWRVRQWAAVKDVPYLTQQLLLEDRTSGINLTLIPSSTFEDVQKMVYEPTMDGMRKCVLAGERSVWDCLPALHVRMDIELVLAKYYEKDFRW